MEKTHSKAETKKEKNNEVLSQISSHLQSAQYIKAEKKIYKLINEYPKSLIYQNLLAI